MCKVQDSTTLSLVPALVSDLAQLLPQKLSPRGRSNINANLIPAEIDVVVEREEKGTRLRLHMSPTLWESIQLFLKNTHMDK